MRGVGVGGNGHIVMVTGALLKDVAVPWLRRETWLHSKRKREREKER